MYDAVVAFQEKLLLWKSQVEQDNLAHFPVCQSISTSFPNAFSSVWFAIKVNQLVEKFDQCFSNFRKWQLIFTNFANPFNINVGSAQHHHQIKLIELQCNRSLKAMFQDAAIEEFYWFLYPVLMPDQTSVHVWENLPIWTDVFNYESEQDQAQITHHWPQPSWCFTNCYCKDLKPDIDRLVSGKSCQSSDQNTSSYCDYKYVLCNIV